MMPTNRRRQRRRLRAKQRRRIAVIVFLLLAIAAGFAAVGFGGAASVGNDCNLSRLQAVSIGSNSFIYAADGSSSARSRRRRTANP